LPAPDSGGRPRRTSHRGGGKVTPEAEGVKANLPRPSWFRLVCCEQPTAPFRPRPEAPHAMTRQSRQARHRHAIAAFAAILTIAGVFIGAAALARAERSGTAVHRRSAPPSAKWDKATSGTFIEDAFSVLQGQRPAFSATRAVAGPAAAPSGTPAAAGSQGGFKWSSLISEETLTDEVKDMKAVVAGVSGRPADFKGGGYDKAREAFSSIALMFAVIAVYDQDVRWKKDAVTARDLFARVGVNCKVGTDQSLAETKLRVADLEAMLDGGSPQGKADREDDFLWSQVAGRPALMSRIESAEAEVSAGMASKADFDRQIDRIRHSAEVLAAVGEAIQKPDYEYHDDDTYKGYSSTMRDAAVKIRDACAKKDYDAARAAASELKKSCDTCHGDYRS